MPVIDVWGVLADPAIPAGRHIDDLTSRVIESGWNGPDD